MRELQHIFHGNESGIEAAVQQICRAMSHEQLSVLKCPARGTRNCVVTGNKLYT